MDDAIKKWLNVGNCSDNNYTNGCEYNLGTGYSHGYARGSGDGCGNGYGFGICLDDRLPAGGIKSINGYTVYKIDDIETIIYTIHGDVARGATLRGIYIIPCYIYRYNGYFAHGETVREAYEDAREKYMNSQPLEDRIASFLEAYPSLDTEVPNNELYKWHHVITGSCKFGRNEFCMIHNIDLREKTTVRDFINIVKDSYGSEDIMTLLKAYNNK